MISCLSNQISCRSMNKYVRGESKEALDDLESRETEACQISHFSLRELSEKLIVVNRRSEAHHTTLFFEGNVCDPGVKTNEESKS